MQINVEQDQYYQDGTQSSWAKQDREQRMKNTDLTLEVKAKSGVLPKKGCEIVNIQL